MKEEENGKLNEKGPGEDDERIRREEVDRERSKRLK
jgi:hypothetical protein